MERDKLAKQLEIISNILENKNIVEQLGKADEKMTVAEMNARVIKILSIAVNENKQDADLLVSMNSGKPIEEVVKMPDKQYATILRRALMNDVLNFFG